MFPKIVVVVIFAYSNLGCLNSRLKVLRREVAQVRQFVAFEESSDTQNCILSNLIVQQYLVSYLLKANLSLDYNFPQFIKIICNRKYDLESLAFSIF